MRVCCLIGFDLDVVCQSKVRASPRAWRLSVKRGTTDAAINASLGGHGVETIQGGGHGREEKTGMMGRLRSRSFLNLGMPICG